MQTETSPGGRRRRRPSQRQPKTEKPCRDCGLAFTAGPFAKWGLCCRWKHRGPKKRQFTPEQDAVIRERYDSRVRGRASEVARAIGLPGWVVKRRAGELGLSHPRGVFKEWSEEEIVFLEENVGVRHVHWIAQRLKRSTVSVIMKLKHQHVSRRVRDGCTMRDLELAIGLDHRRIEHLVASGKLRAKHRGEVHKEAWRFADDDVRDFVRRYPTAFRLDRVDQLWFLDLVFKGRIGGGARAAGEGEAA